MKRTIIVLLTPFVLAIGCLFSIGGRNADAQPRPGGRIVTFNKDVAPIFYRDCTSCHRPGEIAPMSLLTFKDARPWAKSIREKVSTKAMPPWLADPNHGEWLNDRRLGQAASNTIVAWVDGGAREGDPKDLPALPKYAEGWRIGTPDEKVSISGPSVTPDGGGGY